jgi:hypothetical protein
MDVKFTVTFVATYIATYIANMNLRHSVSISGLISYTSYEYYTTKNCNDLNTICINNTAPYYIPVTYNEKMWWVRGKTEKHTGFWWGNLKEREHLEDLSIDTSVTLTQLY